MRRYDNVPRRKNAGRRPAGVDVSVTADQISVKGACGTLVRPVNALVTVKNEGGKLIFAPPTTRAKPMP